MDISSIKDGDVLSFHAPKPTPTPQSAEVLTSNQLPKSNTQCTKDDKESIQSKTIPENGEPNVADQMAVDFTVMEAVLQYLETENIPAKQLTDDQLTWYIKYVIDNVPYQCRSKSIESQTSVESCNSR